MRRILQVLLVTFVALLFAVLFASLRDSTNSVDPSAGENANAVSLR